MVDADLPGGEIELPHALAAGLQRQLEPALALGQAALGQLARGDVPADGQVGGGSTLLVQEHPVDPFLPALALRTRRDVVIVAGARGRGGQAGDVALDLVDLVGRGQVEQVGADHLVDRPLALPRERLVAVEDRAVRAPARDHLGLHVEHLEGRDAEVRRGEAGKLRTVRGDGWQEGHEQARLLVIPDREGAGAGPVGQREPAEPGLGRLDGALLGPASGDGFGEQDGGGLTCQGARITPDYRLERAVGGHHLQPTRCGDAHGGGRHAERVEDHAQHGPHLGG